MVIQFQLSKIDLSLLLGAFLWALPLTGSAIAPQHISDAELADYPIIVVAKWEKAPFTPHHKTRKDNVLGDVITEVEAYTTLKVLRVVKGRVPIGDHTLKLGWAIAWDADGADLTSATSTEFLGDVADVSKANIWFLQQEKSWDPKKKERFLTVSNYREVQPLNLEGYFRAMASRKPQQDVPALLKDGDQETCQRALNYLCGGHDPWPYNTGFLYDYASPREKGERLKSAAPQVAEMMKREVCKDLRAYALAVYAELLGKESITFVRGFSNDPSPDVQAICAGVLSKHQDADSIGAITQASAGVTDGWLGCRVIGNMAEWRDERLVPALISFLENDDCAGSYGTDLHIPAIKARAALLDITGRVFPFDVEAAKQIWDSAAKIDDPKKRAAGNKLPQGNLNPLEATATHVGEIVKVRICNRSTQPLTMAL